MSEASWFCDDKQHKMERFLEVCLLLLLYDNVGYGYGLIEQLEDFGFTAEDLNVSTLYRTLRQMESRGQVVSSWSEGGPGPRRRVYELTPEGKADLETWVLRLEMRKARIEKVIERYEQQIANTVVLQHPEGG